MLLPSLILTLLSLLSVDCFNFDTSTHFSVVEGPRGSNFGFKIQSYKNFHSSQPMLVVSAPRLSRDLDGTGLVRGHGGLLVCDLKKRASKCNRQFFFDSKVNLLRKENRTSQHLGWSLQVADVADNTSQLLAIVACAPMWRFHHSSVSEMSGACFLSRLDRASDSILVDQRYTTPLYPCLYRDAGQCQREWSPVGSGRESPMRDFCNCIDGFTSILVKGRSSLSTVGNNNGASSSLNRLRQQTGVAILGAPGGSYWAGGAMAAPLQRTWQPASSSVVVPEFKAMSAGPKDKRDSLLDSESRFEYDNGLFGFAMAYYAVESAGTIVEGLAITGLKTKTMGEVVLAGLSLAHNEASVDYFRNNSVVRGRLLSEAFGFALACGDIDGDDLPEIFVGAPFHFSTANGTKSGENSSTAAPFDTGAVYVYRTELVESDTYAGPPFLLQFDPYQNDSPMLITGSQSQARFGWAIEYLGDINDDGLGDVAISAPFGGKDKAGVVYIYLGGRSFQTPSQVITASNVMPTNLLPPTSPLLLATSTSFLRSSTSSSSQMSVQFGASLQGRYDVDSNGYPDLLIGAIGADTAVVLYSRPIVRLTGNASVFPAIIDANETKLAGQGCKPQYIAAARQASVVCATLTYCLQYTGRSLPDKLSLDIRLESDILPSQFLRRLSNSATSPSSPRASFEVASTSPKRTKNRSIDLAIGRPFCASDEIFIQTKPSDPLTPLVFQVTVTMAPGSRSNNLAPMFASATGENTTLNASSDIAKNCGIDNICIPDIQLRLDDKVVEVVIGETKRPFLLNFTVGNAGEDAYGASVIITVPKAMAYSGRIAYDLTSTLTSSEVQGLTSLAACSPFLSSEFGDNATHPNEASNEVICELPQPFAHGRRISIQLQFGIVASETWSGSTSNITISASSFNEEEKATLQDNNLEVILRLRTDVTLQLSIFPTPEQLEFSTIDFPADDGSNLFGRVESVLGPPLQISILLENVGATTASRVDFGLTDWPIIGNNESQLYVMSSAQFIRGRGRCYAGPPINPLQLLPEVDALASSQFTATSKYSTSLTNLRCYAFNVAGGDYARLVLQTRLNVRNLINQNPSLSISPHRIFESVVSTSRTSTTSFKLRGYAVVSRIGNGPSAAQLAAATARRVEASTIVEVVRTHPIGLATLLADSDLWWLIVIAVGAGLLVVTIIFSSLYLAGCFDRKIKRPKANYVKLATFEPLKTQATRLPLM